MELLIKQTENKVMELQVATRRKTSSLIKKHLKEKFGINVSVRSESYSGGTSLNIRYRGGVDESVVSEEMDKLQYGRFDGSTDMYEYRDNGGITVDGYKLEEFKYVFVKQEFTDKGEEWRDSNFWREVSEILSENLKHSEVEKFTGDLSTQFSHRVNGCWNWNQLSQRLLSVRNFVCQDIENILFTGIVDSHSWPDTVLIYEYNGKEYRTDGKEITND